MDDFEILRTIGGLKKFGLYAPSPEPAPCVLNAFHEEEFLHGPLLHQSFISEETTSIQDLRAVNCELVRKLMAHKPLRRP